MADAAMKKMKDDNKAEAFKKTIAILQALPKEDRDAVIKSLAVFFEVTMPSHAASVAFWSR